MADLINPFKRIGCLHEYYPLSALKHGSFHRGIYKCVKCGKTTDYPVDGIVCTELEAFKKGIIL